ncbi:MAG: Asp-tRNA(Asn)/Glu-tRNA(Gln) amidotransferase subunit GatC [Minisyncoccales bacterium]
MSKKEEIKHIADLAKLNFEEEKENKILEEVASILDYMEILKEVDVTGIKPMGHVHEKENVLRRDKVVNVPQDVKDKILKSAPDLKDNHFKVNTILNKEE